MKISEGATRCLGVLAVAAACCVPLAALAQADYTLVELEGSVEISRGEPARWEAAHAGQALRGGDAVRTGYASRAEVAWSGRTVRLYENSLLRLPETRSRVKLDQGHMLVDVETAAGSDPLEVETPVIVAIVKGTRFAVSADPAGDPPLAVFEGEVAATRVGDAESFPVLVREGFALELAGGGAMRLYLHRGGDPWPAWSSGGGRAPRFESRQADRDRQGREILRGASDALLPTRPRNGGPVPAVGDLDPVQDVADPKRVLGGNEESPPPPPPPPPDDDDDD